MRRTDLKPTAIQEQFNVPLISNNVKEFIERYVEENSAVLDIGCGEQPFRELIEDKKGKYYSLDIAQNSKGNVDYICKIDESIENLNKMSFDIILCTEVLEHVVNWEVSFKNICKLTKNKGYLIFTSPFVYPIHEAPHDYWRPTLHTFEIFATQNNFKIVKQIKAGDFWSVLGTVLAHSYLENENNSILSKIRIRIVRFIYNYILKQTIKYGKLKGINAQSSLYSVNIVALQKEEI